MSNKNVKPEEIILKLSKTLEAHNLSRISYKGKDANGNDMEVTLEASIPVFSHNIIPNNIPTPIPSHIPNNMMPAVSQKMEEKSQHSNQPSSSNSSSNDKVVKSPLVGVIYVASKPDAQPYVKIGDKITKGQDLFIIECMKTMNLVKSTEEGTVKNILVQNGKPVEYDQPLLVLE